MIAVLVLAGLGTAGCADPEPTDAERREQWLAAEPRDSSASGVDPDIPDRCDLYSWVDTQLAEGQTEAEVEAAVGPPDLVRDQADQRLWIWELGTCSLLDYDSYVIVFGEGTVTRFGYQQG